MKLTTNRKQLLNALDMVSGAIAKRSTIPILQNVLLNAVDDGLHVTGTDLETSVQTWIPAELDGIDPIKTSGTVTVSHATMQKFVKAMKAETVSIESQELTHQCGKCEGVGIVPSDNPPAVISLAFGYRPQVNTTTSETCTDCEGRGFHVTGIKVLMTAGPASITVDGMSIDSYPAIPQFGQDEKFPTKDILDIDSSAWLDMVSKVRFAISREESRFTLNGFLLDVNGAIRMVATDGHRLSLVQRGETCDSPHVTALIPAHGADQIKRIFGKSNRSLDIKRTVCPDTIDANGKSQPAPQYWIVRSGDTTVSGRILTGNFPDYERIMPNYEGQHARLTASDLLAGIDAVYNSADERSHSVQFHFNCSTVKLIASTAGGSASSIEIPCETGIAHGVNVGLNADYIRDFAKSLRKDDSIYISCAGSEFSSATEMYERGEISLSEMDEREAKRISAGASNPWEFSSSVDPGYKHVIMPMRI